MSKKHLVLIDGYGFLFRAYHALPPLNRPDGTPVGAVYGFVSMMLKIIKDFQFSHIAVVLDSGVKSFRNEIYKEYKAHRPPAPDDLIPQFPIIRDAIIAMNIPILEKVGFEADDLIATYAKNAASNDFVVTIISSDKDLMQLITDGQISMFDALKNKNIGEKEVEEKFGVQASKLLNALALMGDSADNIPGVPGIGPKTAAELINRFGTIENIYQNINEIKQDKRRESLVLNKENAFLSRKLITLIEDIPLDISLDLLSAKKIDLEIFSTFLQAQNFKSLSNKINNFKAKDEVIEIIEVKNNHQLEDIIKKANDLGFIAIDIEYENKEITKIFLALDYNKACVISLKTDLFSSAENISLASLKELFADKSILKITSNLKKLMHLLDFTEFYACEDVELANYILGQDLKDILSTIENYNSNAIGSYLLKIWDETKQNLFQNKMLVLYERIEKPLIKVLFSMEKNGIKIDSAFLAKLSHAFANTLSELEKIIYKLAGCEFNIASPKQLSHILFEKMGISFANNKAQSTNAEILEELVASGHEIAARILSWRHLAKLKNTYTDTLGKDVDKENRIHTTYLMTSTSTGRLSSIEPNLQNIPIKTTEGNLIRKAFIAQTSHKLISADYSQIELRLLAHIAKVTPLINAFRNNLDIHKITAAEIFNVKLAEVDENMRSKAKTINFSIIYGISAFGLANRLGISNFTAKEYIDSYFKKYPQILEYMEKTKEFARSNGYVETLFGRKCYLKTINAKNNAERSFAERAAINAPIQGTQADIIKIAMNEIFSKIDNSAKMLLQIHDELILEDTEENAENTAKLMKKTMENVEFNDFNFF